MSKKILITGTGSGLGKFLSNKYKNVICVSREIPLQKHYKKIHTIIHCAFNLKREDLNLFPNKVYKDNVVLTEKLLKIPHKRFVYISTCQIDEMNIETESTPYIILKCLNEHMVRKKGRNYLILRPSSLLGNGMKSNSIVKLMKGNDITLTGNSVNDFVLYDDVYEAIQKPLSGTFYLLSNEKISMKEVSEHFDKKIKFGKFKYQIKTNTNIDTKKTSLENLIKHFGGE